MSLDGITHRHFEPQDWVPSELQLVGHWPIVIVEVNTTRAEHFRERAELFGCETLMLFLFLCPVFLLS